MIIFMPTITIERSFYINDDAEDITSFDLLLVVPSNVYALASTPWFIPSAHISAQHRVPLTLLFYMSEGTGKMTMLLGVLMINDKQHGFVSLKSVEHHGTSCYNSNVKLL
jgi:hypothetical protein